jgi:hypothetical protein
MSLARSRAFASAALPLLLPVLLVLVFLMHLRSLPQFLDFRLRYVPTPPDVVVHALAGRDRGAGRMVDPHLIAYLSLPLLLATGRMLHRIARARRPLASAIAFGVTAVGTVYLGGLLGMWTAFFGGLVHLDPRDADGAVAAFAAMSAPRGAFLLTTTLAKLAFVGLALQGLALWGRDARSRAAALFLAVGSALFLVFWDLDNWMLVGSLLLMAGVLCARGIRALKA